MTLSETNSIPATAYRARPFTGGLSGDDLTTLMRVASQVWEPERRPYAACHPGDLSWRLRDLSYEAELWLWEGEATGETVGFTEWSAEGRYLDLQRSAEDSALIEAVLSWGEARLPGQELTVSADEADTTLLSILAARGYERKPEPWTHLHRRLLDPSVPVVGSPLPEGFAVRSMAGPGEAITVEARVQGHRDGWESVLLTLEKYGRLMVCSNYRPELDLVVLAPDGTVAATANVWLDPASGAGLFEPVSTSHRHRRLGLGRALMLYGQEQLRRLGARSAWVCSRSNNPAATGLYVGSGMPVVSRTFEHARGPGMSGASGG